MVINFFYTQESVFRAIKEESSQLAIRKTDKDGNSLFDNLVFDEAYLITFRRLFFDAQAEVISALEAYIPNDDTAFFFEPEDFSKDINFSFVLCFPGDFKKALAKPIEIKVRQFLLTYIMYRWLETKLPDEAAVYLKRSEALLNESKELLDRRLESPKIEGKWF